MAPGEEQDFDPTKDATVKLLRHITEKGFQLGSCIGSFIVVPVIAYRGRASNCPTVPKMLRGLSRSAVYTTIAAGLLGLGMVYGTPLTPEGIQDRVYRLHYNEGQNRTDTFCRAGAVAGAAAAAAKFGAGRTALNAGAAFGASLAVLAHVASYEGAEKGLKTGPTNMLNELKREN
ncbi:TPA: hypothetical protein ACH3X2_011814 [Trebouxia sp. C0005]